MSPRPSSRDLLGRLDPFGVRLDLEPIRRLLAAGGDPHLELSVVLVAGTNGKGSTASLLAAMARAAGYRTGLYVSPHLEQLHERITLDGAAIPEARLAAYLREAIDLGDGDGDAEPPTSFEALTFAALRHFHAEAVDLAVLEVGLGGRLDATNVCQPVVSIVTAVGLDHQSYLGDDLRSVAAEKAHVARADRTLVGWGAPAEVEEALLARADDVGARYVPAQRLAFVEPVHRRGPGGRRVRVTTPRGRYALPLPLPGAHQRNNAALAVLAAEALQEAGWERLDAAAMARGAAAWRWPGRLEWVPLPRRRWVLLDVAHNPAGTDSLVTYLNDPGPGGAGLAGRGLDMHLLFGTLEDKAVDAMLPPLAELASRAVLTRAPGPRGGDPEPWRELAEAVDGEVAVVADPGAALDAALDELPPGAVLVACGSVALVGELRRRLRDRFGVPAPVLG